MKHLQWIFYSIRNEKPQAKKYIFCYVILFFINSASGNEDWSIRVERNWADFINAGLYKYNTADRVADKYWPFLTELKGNVKANPGFELTEPLLPLLEFTGRAHPFPPLDRTQAFRTYSLYLRFLAFLYINCHSRVCTELQTAIDRALDDVHYRWVVDNIRDLVVSRDEMKLIIN